MDRRERRRPPPAGGVVNLADEDEGGATTPRGRGNPGKRRRRRGASPEVSFVRSDSEDLVGPTEAPLGRKRRRTAAHAAAVRSAAIAREEAAAFGVPPWLAAAAVHIPPQLADPDEDLKKAIAMSKSAADAELRRKQDAELAASLELDRAREESKRLAERAEMERKRSLERAKEERKQLVESKLAALKRSLPAEPAQGAGRTVRLRLETNGIKQTRSFPGSATLRDIAAWVQVADRRCLLSHRFELVLPSNARVASDDAAALTQNLLALDLNMSCIRTRVLEEDDSDDEADGADGGGTAKP